MARVAPDADVLIGFLDEGDAHHQRARELLGGHLRAGDEIVVGASVYAEAMVRPLRLGRPEPVEDFLAAVRADVAPVTREVARAAARLRADHRALRLGDAMALAAARAADARLLTFDVRLARLIPRGGG